MSSPKKLQINGKSVHPRESKIFHQEPTWSLWHGGFLKWVPPKSSIYRWIFHHKPSSYWGIPIYGNPHICNLIKKKCILPRLANTSRWCLCAIRMSNLRCLETNNWIWYIRIYGKQNLLTIVTLPFTKVDLFPSWNNNQPTKKEDVRDVHQFIKYFGYSLGYSQYSTDKTTGSNPKIHTLTSNWASRWILRIPSGELT